MALPSWSSVIGSDNLPVSRLANMTRVNCSESALRIGTPLQPRRSARLFQTNASSASVDTFLEKPLADVSYEVPVHTVIVHDRQREVTHTFEVPEDQYILHTGEDNGLDLPFACRHGCCTACAVRVKSGEISQPRALGISPELKAKGYALMCVGFPLTDVELETQDEDEVYWLQFGRYFAQGPLDRDDFALELAMGDE